MAKYKLIQMDDDKNNKEKILFNKIENFRNLNKDNIKDIVKFTGLFKSEQELSEFLKKHKLIKNEGKFDIVYRYGGEDKQLEYGVTYRSDLYFFGEENMKKFAYQNHLNYSLINNLCNYIDDKENQKNNLLQIKEYLESEEFGVISTSNEKYIDYLIALDKVIVTECYQKGSKIENFEKLRDLAMFFSNQYKNNENLTFNYSAQNNEIINYVKNNEIYLNEKVEKVKEKQGKIRSNLSYIF